MTAEDDRKRGDDEESTDSEDEGDRDPRKTLDSAYSVTYQDQMLGKAFSLLMIERQL